MDKISPNNQGEEPGNLKFGMQISHKICNEQLESKIEVKLLDTLALLSISFRSLLFYHPGLNFGRF